MWRDLIWNIILAEEIFGFEKLKVPCSKMFHEKSEKQFNWHFKVLSDRHILVYLRL